jgi:hypothetical protein
MRIRQRCHYSILPNCVKAQPIPLEALAIDELAIIRGGILLALLYLPVVHLVSTPRILP